MLDNIWSSSETASEKLGITEIKLSYLREKGLLKPGVHWRSAPSVQKKPWNPQAIYNVNLCSEIINEIYLEDKDIIAA